MCVTRYLFVSSFDKKNECVLCNMSTCSNQTKAPKPNQVKKKTFYIIRNENKISNVTFFVLLGFENGMGDERWRNK